MSFFAAMMIAGLPAWFSDPRLYNNDNFKYGDQTMNEYRKSLRAKTSKSYNTDNDKRI